MDIINVVYYTDEKQQMDFETANMVNRQVTDYVKAGYALLSVSMFKDEDQWKLLKELKPKEIIPVQYRKTVTLIKQ